MRDRSVALTPIATYPRFTKLELQHRPLVNKFGATYDRYSEFNFTSLFSWDTDGSAAISVLNDNLVIRLPDYLTGEPCYSMLGDTDVDQAVATLLQETAALKLVPEVVIASLRRPEDFIICEDPDNHDYVYQVLDHVRLAGNRFKKLRNKLSRFVRDTEATEPVVVAVGSAVDAKRLATYEALLHQWMVENDRTLDDCALEMTAIARLLEHSDSLNLVIVEFRRADRLVAFSISELLGGGWAICHFQKALRIHKYFSAFITVKEAEILSGLGCTRFNWEQDLGVDGLRTSKSIYRPVELLRKYVVSRPPDAHTTRASCP